MQGSLDLDPETNAKSVQSGTGDAHYAPDGLGLEPAKRQAPILDCAAQAAAEMMTMFRPVLAHRARWPFKIECHRSQSPPQQLVAGVLVERTRAIARLNSEAPRKFDAELASNVAGAVSGAPKVASNLT